MVMFYFSATGNSKYIAELFSEHMDCPCYSIEDRDDYSAEINLADSVAFCYPIYGSRVPRIMRDFVFKHHDRLQNKRIVILCTQMYFSGDGARVFADMLPSAEVAYAEHILMPNNVCNLFIIPLASDKNVRKYIEKAQIKIKSVCDDIKAGIVKKRGFNRFSRMLGSIQGRLMPMLEEKYKSTVRVNNDCTNCRICVNNCPMKNLVSENNKIIQQNNCIICYRCVNNCPKKAITTSWHGKVKKQYQLVCIKSS